MINDATSRDIAYKNFFADIILKSLKSIVLSKDSSLYFYKIKLTERKANQLEFEKFSQICADIIVRKANVATNNNIAGLSREERESIVRKSLKEAWNQFQKQE